MAFLIIVIIRDFNDLTISVFFLLLLNLSSIGGASRSVILLFFLLELLFLVFLIFFVFFVLL